MRFLPLSISKSDPIFSEEARKAHIQSTVGLSIVVNTDGTPEQIRVVKGAGFGLDERAVEAVTKWRFNPGSLHSVAVKVRAKVVVNFRMLPVPMEPAPTHLTRLNFILPQGVIRPQLIVGNMRQDFPASPGQNVGLSMTVDTAGAVTSLIVLTSTDPVWEALIRKAVATWKFSPATQNGKPVIAEGVLAVSSPAR